MEVWRRGAATTEKIYQDAGELHGDERTRKREWAARAEKRYPIESALKQLEAQADIVIRHDAFDQEPWLFNVQNGTIDLRTGKVREHCRLDMLTKIAPASFDAAAKCPQWMKFLDDIMAGDIKLQAFLQRIVGYALTGSTKEQKLFFLHGAGANGKSVFLDTMLHVFGDYGRRIAPDLLFLRRNDTHPTALADLQGVRLAVTTETEQGRRLAEVLVKELSGGDRLTARKMRQDYFEFEPTHKIFQSGNHLPVIRGTDHAIWRRIDLIPFEVVFADADQDKDLAAKLREEANGILRWCVNGTLEWLRYGLTEPDKVVAATREYRSDMDILGDFFDDRCVIVPCAEVSNPDLRKAYETWCEANGERAISARALGLNLKERGFTQTSAGPKRTRTWSGIGIKANT